MKNKDVFFGQAPYDLFTINEIAKTVSDSHFVAQVNRYLTYNGGCLDIFCGVSSPPFETLIKKLTKESIGRIKIFSRTDQNDAVNATLSCEILLEQGVINVVPQWCAYKEMRAEEIVTTLLLPLHSLGLQNVTFLEVDDKLIPLLEAGENDFESELRAIFSLAQYPRCYDERYVAMLKNAVKE